MSLDPPAWPMRKVSPAADRPAGAQDPVDLERLAAEVPIVLDHQAYVRGDRPDEVERLLALLRTGRVWLKLSGFYRLVGDARGVDRLLGALMARLFEDVPDRLLWGSGWPHTPPHSAGPSPRFRHVDTGEQLRPLLGSADARTLERILVDNPRTLYDFGPLP